jgi:hypothetical protein
MRRCEITSEAELTILNKLQAYNWVKNSLLCETFVVEGKMIVVDSFKYSPFSFEKGSGIYPLVQNAEESSAKIPSPAPPTTPGRRICMVDPTG